MLRLAFHGAWLGGVLTVGACFRPDDALRGQPCTSSSSCGDLSCSYGVCGGPQRCEAGAGVGDYCFTLTDASYPAGASPTSLAAGQVNLDPYPDIVVGDVDGSISLLINDQRGGFHDALVSAPLDSAVRDLAIGRVDAQGWSEIVVTTTSGSVWVVPVTAGSDERGAFEAPASAATGLEGPSRPQIGAFVDDVAGKADIAVLVRGGIDVREQTGSLEFIKPNPDTFVDQPTDIRTIGQSMDVVYVAWAGDARLKTFARTPAGTFSERMPIPTGVAAARFILEDVTDDNYADVLAAGSDGSMWLSRGKNADLEKAARPIKVYDLGWKPSLLAAAELDDDLDREFIVAGGPEVGRGDVYLFDNDGDGLPVYGGGLGLTNAIAAVVSDIDVDDIGELIAIDGDRGRIRVARRTVAPPPVGGGSGSTTGGGMMTSSPTSMTQGSHDESGTDPTVDPSFPGETGVETGGSSCDVILGSTCYASTTVYDALPTNGRLLMADLSTDGVFDVVAAGDGAIVMIPGIPGIEQNVFDEDARVTTGVDIGGVVDLVLRPGGFFPDDPRSGVLPNRLVVADAQGLLEWTVADGASGLAMVANTRALLAEYVYPFTEGDVCCGLAPLGVLGDASLAVYASSLEFGLTDEVELDANALALYVDSDFQPLVVAAAADGLHTFFAAAPGLGLAEGELWLPEVSATVLQADWGGSGALIAADQSTLYGRRFDGSLLEPLQAFGDIDGVRVGDVDGDGLGDLLVVESLDSEQTVVSLVSTASGEFEYVGSWGIGLGMWQIRDVELLNSAASGYADLLVYIQPTDGMSAPFLLVMTGSLL